MAVNETFRYDRAHVVKSYEKRGFPWSLLPLELQVGACIRTTGNSDTLVVTHIPTGKRLNEAMTQAEAAEVAREYGVSDPNLIHKVAPNHPGPTENEYISTRGKIRISDLTHSPK